MASTKFSHVSSLIIEDIKNELRLQGHYDTGALEASLQELFIERPRSLNMSATALGYLEELEYGVNPSDINENKIDFTKLAAWVGRKIKPEDNLAVAHLIVKKWKQQGKPLDSSRAFSKTGSVILAIEQVFQRHDSYTPEIDEAIYDDFDSEFHTTKSGIL